MQQWDEPDQGLNVKIAFNFKSRGEWGQLSAGLSPPRSASFLKLTSSTWATPTQQSVSADPTATLWAIKMISSPGPLISYRADVWTLIRHGVRKQSGSAGFPPACQSDSRLSTDISPRVTRRFLPSNRFRGLSTSTTTCCYANDD